MTKTMEALRKFAMKMPDAEEGVACKGTVIEQVTAKINKKAFLYLGNVGGQGSGMLKLKDSVPEAVKLTATHPNEVKAGLGGWTKVHGDTGGGPLVEVYLLLDEALISRQQ